MIPGRTQQLFHCWAEYAAMACAIATRDIPPPGATDGYLKVVEIAEWRRRIQHFVSELV